MDFQEYVEKFEPMTCIISVEKLKDGGYGEIRIVAGNKAYIQSIEDPHHVSSSSMLDNKFVPNSLYEKYIPKDLNFEDSCYNSAIKKKIMHTYIHPERYDFWINMVMMPLASDDPNMGYCSYSQELTLKGDADMMANTSAETSAAVIKTCIKLRSTDNFPETMNEIINDIRELCGADQCCILLTDFKERKCSVLAEAYFDETRTKRMNYYIEEGFFDVVESWKNTIAGSSCLIVQGEKDMQVLKERNPVWYDSLVEAEVNSVVLFPLKHNNEVLGYIWAVNFDTEQTSKIKDTLEITSYFIASEIANYQLLNKLEILSSVDLLTGIYNRNAMNNRIFNITSGRVPSPKCFGIIFADLNGLKQKNDEEGHVEGDKLLKGAAALLKETFPECEIYRAGGDEFMLIAVDVGEEVLKERVEKLRKDSEDPENISFALGLYCDDNGGDIRAAMRTADERMYEDKKRYYGKYPERRRR
ncbi:sensor domain-containing diguanylate cyclase [Ruminococcus flavefaciens]|uniref:sensor domain-containing diguanylate cyclase n=1 Tax=Ruminococcus flavefaciens TaxID=1265 RepID=UPI00048AD301|nr:sensor domain-containing diguanylate cyclase [Ruminococcus flavefaciens]